jgi:hypothetical protein
MACSLGTLKKLDLFKFNATGVANVEYFGSAGIAAGVEYLFNSKLYAQTGFSMSYYSAGWLALTPVTDYAITLDDFYSVKAGKSCIRSVTFTAAGITKVSTGGVKVAGDVCAQYVDDVVFKNQQDYREVQVASGSDTFVNGDVLGVTSAGVIVKFDGADASQTCLGVFQGVRNFGATGTGVCAAGASFAISSSQVLSFWVRVEGRFDTAGTSIQIASIAAGAPWYSGTGANVGKIVSSISGTPVLVGTQSESASTYAVLEVKIGGLNRAGGSYSTDTGTTPSTVPVRNAIGSLPMPAPVASSDAVPKVYSDAFANQMASLKNKIINGHFPLWMRRTSLLVTTAGNKYVADRWATVIANTGESTTTSQQYFAAGQTDVPRSPDYYHRQVITNGGNAATGYVINRHYVENVQFCAGRAHVLTFYAKADAAKSFSVSYAQNFGTAGSADVVGAIGKVSLTTSWQKFTLPITFPSISGKTLGGDWLYNSYTLLQFWYSGGSNYNVESSTLGIQTGTFDIANVQLEEGSYATDFDNRPYGVEKILCQRYYQKSTPDSVVAAASATAEQDAGHIRLWFNSINVVGAPHGSSDRYYYPVTLRKSVAPTLFGHTSSQMRARALNATTWSSLGGAFSAGTSTAEMRESDERGFCVGHGSDSIWTGNTLYQIAFQFTVDAEF